MKQLQKIPVAILGATGMVGQKFVELLSNHPWFEIAELAASSKSEGKTYRDAMQWMMPSPLDPKLADIVVKSCKPSFSSRLVFSALDASVAGDIELAFAKAGYSVVSNASNHRMSAHVPLLIPEVNPTHLDLVREQQHFPGIIVTNPNCSVIGLTMALKPLLHNFGIKKVHVTTLQAVSGAGYPGVASFDILDNVIPFISGEEEKLETEPLKILGNATNRVSHSMKLSAHCNRVAVMDGHLACVSVQFEQPATAEDIIDQWNSFRGEPQELNLPSAPKQPLIYLSHPAYPQPKLHRSIDRGMAVSIGRLRPCPLLDWKFALLSHNTIRGAAGCAILNAELMVAKGYIN